MINREQAFKIIEDIKQEELAHGREENTWYKFYNHVFGAGEIASRIAARIEGMDPERAFVMGILHDYGRTREDREKIQYHPIIGYNFFKDKDPDVARGCLVHMFPFNEIPEYEKMKKTFFYNEADYNLLVNFVEENPLSEYDILVQLSDALSNANGFVTMEQRLDDFEKRHGVKMPYSRMEPYYRLKDFFDRKLGMNVYDLFGENNEGFI